MSAIESEPAAATADPAAEEDVGTGIPAQPGALVGVAARQSDRVQEFDSASGGARGHWRW